MDSKPRISIIIPAYDDALNLENLLRSIRIYSIPEIEIWVIDDGSANPLEKTAKAYGAHYHYQQNSGPSMARNRGASLAKGEFLLFLDSDTEVLSDTLPKVLELTRKPDLNVATLMYHPVSLNRGFAPEFKGLFDAFVWIFRSEGPATELQEQCCLFRKSVFLELGGWHSQFNKPDIEHEEFTTRILQKYVIWFVPGIFVKHQFPILKKLLANLFWRCLSWGRLKINKKVRYNDLRYTPSYIFVTMMPFLSAVSLLLSWFCEEALGFSALFFGIYLAGNFRLFRYFLREGEGMRGVMYLLPHFLVSIAVGLGGLVGGLTFWRSKVSYGNEPAYRNP